MYWVPTWAKTQPALAGLCRRPKGSGVRRRRPPVPGCSCLSGGPAPGIHAITRFHIDRDLPRSGSLRFPAEGPGGKERGRRDPARLAPRGLGRVQGDLGV